MINLSGSGLSTTQVNAQVAAALAAYDAATETDTGATNTLIALLNDISAAQVRTQADGANVAYDAATGAELTALNDVSPAEVNTGVDSALVDYDAATGTELGVVDANVDDLIFEAEHITYIFPEDTDETVILTAGGTNNVWSAWTEIVDNNNVTLSSKAAVSGMHGSSMMVENASVKDKVYMAEVAYGAGHTIVSRQRFMAQDTKTGTTQQVRFRAAQVPAGETIYYRAKCETASATVQVHIRYHIHG